MKKVLSILVLALVAVQFAFAGDVITQDTKQLPLTARNFINQYFSKPHISHIKIESEILQTKKYGKRLLNYILCIRFFIEVHSIVSASRFFHMPTYLRVVIECQSRFFPFFPAFSRNCPDYFLHTSGSSSFRSLSDLGAR